MIGSNPLAPVLADTARELSESRATAVRLEAERDAYRLLSHTALEQISTLTKRTRQQSETIRRLHAIIRDYLGDRHGVAA